MKFITLLLLLFASCQVNHADLKSGDSGDTITMWVAHYQVPCVGSGAPRLCLLAQEGTEKQAGEWENFYSQIRGFEEYKMGYDYQLEVRKTKRNDVPADAGLFRYELVRMITKQKVDNGVRFELLLSDGAAGLPANISRENDGTITLLGRIEILPNDSLDTELLESALSNEWAITGVFTHSNEQNKLHLKELKAN